MSDPAAKAASPPHDRPTAHPSARDRPMKERRLGLFEAYGVEIEIMIVDQTTLDVKPVCDELLASVAGEPTSDVVLGDVTWSNELTLHVLELKTSAPAPSLTGLAAGFHGSLDAAKPALERLGARLMPGA